jgi:hypothetical protein
MLSMSYIQVLVILLFSNSTIKLKLGLHIRGRLRLQIGTPPWAIKLCSQSIASGRLCCAFHQP